MSLKSLSAKSKIPKLLASKLRNKRVYKIYKNFEKSLDLNKNFIVAVSGGPDSLALAFLTKIYSIKNRLKPKFIIIDHKLRPGSANEAKIVQKVLKKYFIKASILVWRGKKPIKNIQSIARNKRYELLFKNCEKFNINHIILGHHQDDLLENFFIRLLRGSGLKGLVSLDKENTIKNISLLRPLLNQKKEELVFLAKYVFDFYVDDPSNNNINFKRIMVRKLINELQKIGLDQNKFLKTVNNLKYSNKIVDFYTKENLKKNTFFSKRNNKYFFNCIFFQQPEEVVFRAFSESIRLIGKRYYSVRGKKIVKILRDIENNEKLRVTLGGCVIEKANQTVIISKEY